MASTRRVRPTALPPGVTITADGASFRVSAGYATAVELCLFTSDGTEVRHPMTPTGDGGWVCHVTGVGVGARYGFRVEGPWDPRAGHRHNPAKLLLDPYARAVDGAVVWRPEVFGHAVDADFAGDPDVRDARDSAPYVPRGVVVDTTFDWGDDTPPATPWADTVIYETHVRGFTRQHPEVPEELRGTYAGLAHPSSVRHLTDLGVTAVELLPVHAFVDEPHLVTLGLTNYWGYNSLGFFAPHAAYAVDPEHAVIEFKTMVKTLHAAGLEVILDVVYNHTCEQGGHEGATLSLRGFDNATTYRLDEQGNDVDVTGCGNSVDTREITTMRLVLDSLRYWVEEMHVDGFRFDLAVTLGRGPGDDFDARAALLSAIQTDPILSRVKLIAEPWDVGMHGWRTGQFPAPFAEWNDRFRNSVRDFWFVDSRRQHRGEAPHGMADLATRLAGSRDLFGTRLRGPHSSINFVTAHDGFTLADLASYDEKHNEANGEENRDGTTDNRSWNHGVEGPTSDAAVLDARHRTMRNVFATLVLAAGVPMITGGDEFARTQRGNNNAYCQDSPISWLDWNRDERQLALTESVRRLLAVRAEHEILRRAEFFDGGDSTDDGAAGLSWFAADGTPMTAARWESPSTRTVQAFFDGREEHPTSVLVVVHGGADPIDVTLPSGHWTPLWTSATPSGEPSPVTGGDLRLDGPTVWVGSLS